MPHDNIKRAVMKGTGELPGMSYEEYRYEGYGPGGVAILVDVLTDNKNRTVPEIRHIMSKHGGNLGEAGCVAWMFEQKGYIIVDKGKVDEDALMTVALDAGALEMKNDPKEDNYEVITNPEDLNNVMAASKRPAFLYACRITMLPTNYILLDGKNSEQMMKQRKRLRTMTMSRMYANFDMPDEVMTKAER